MNVAGGSATAAVRGRRVAPTNDFEPFRQEEIEQSVPARFEQQVRRYPDRLAIRSRTQQLTYAELNKAANRIAHAVLEQCGDGEEPVALLLDQGAAVIAAIMGVLKAGKIYVPLDPMFPPARIASMAEDARAGLIVTSSRHLATAADLTPASIPRIDIDALDAGLSDADPGVAVAPDRGFHLLYTSGSTGQPKGVLQNHRNLLFEVMRLTNSFHVCREDRLALLHSCCSSASLRRIFPALLNGASLHPLDIKAEGVGDLPNWLIQEGITISSGKRLLRDCAHALTGEDQFPCLRLATFGGEPVYPRDVELYRQFLPQHCLMVINLAATETGTDRQYFIDKETEIAGALLPVGYPTDGTEILLLDEDGREVGPDQVGEIAVRSRYLSLGYWRRPELTRERFRPDPDGGDARLYLTGDLGRMRPDGCLFHLGRKDFQVKVRGYRIEAAEVETALLNLGAFAEVVVLAREPEASNVRSAAERVDGSVESRSPEPAEKRLVAYLIPASRPAPSISALRRALANTLPEYMIPSTFVMLDVFPRTPTGKVDRKELPPPPPVRPELDSPFVAPRNAVEQLLAGIWARRLGLDEVGIHDSFLELGGNSLLAAQVLARIREALGIELPLRVLFEAPTVAELAQALVEREPEPGWVESMAPVQQQIERMSEEDLRAALQQLQQ